MRIIDLSQELYSGMPVYPGDPQVVIDQVHTIDKQGWRLSELHMPTHVGSHVDAFSHMDEQGTTLDKIPLERFFGKAQVVMINQKYPSGIGLFFITGELTLNDVDNIVAAKPNFVCIAKTCVFPVAVEKALLTQGIVTFTDLVNTELLPRTPFMFYGFPLKIKDGDGSPVRTVAVVE